MAQDIPNRSIRADCKDHYLLYTLRQARLNQDYTVRQLAAEVGITPMAYLHYERLRKIPTPARAEKISRILNIPRQDIFPSNLREIVLCVRGWRQEKRQKMRTHPPDFFDCFLAQTEQQREERERYAECVERMLANLPPRQRQTLQEYYGLGGPSRSYAAIARERGSHETTVREQAQQGIKHLRNGSQDCSQALQQRPASLVDLLRGMAK